MPGNYITFKSYTTLAKNNPSYHGNFFIYHAQFEIYLNKVAVPSTKLGYLDSKNQELAKNHKKYTPRCVCMCVHV
jgi:hypothetical protein